MQNLIQEKQAELEVINLAKSISAKSNQNAVHEQEKNKSPLTLTITPGHSVGKQSSAFTIVKQQIAKEPSVEAVSVVPESIAKPPSIVSVPLALVKEPSVVSIKPKTPVELAKAPSVTSIKAPAQVEIAKVPSVTSVNAASIEILKALSGAPVEVIETPVEIAKTASTTSAKIEAVEITKTPSVTSTKTSVTVPAPVETVKAQPSVISTKSATLVSAPVEIVKAPSVTSAKVEIIKAPSVTSTKTVSVPVEIVKVPSVTTVELNRQPSARDVTTSFMLDDIAKMIQEAFPLGLKVASQEAFEPIYQKQSRSSSQFHLQEPIKSTSTIKSPSNIALAKSVSSVKQAEPIKVASQSKHEQSPKATPIRQKTTSSSKINIPEGYTLAEPQYIGNLDPANGVTIEYLQNLINQHASKKDQFPDTHLEDIEYNTFVDPFTSNLFQDEIIEIDYGAIDAFTTAFNSNLDSNSKGAQPHLKVNSNILESKFSSFVDNQLLLGDYIDASLQFTSFDAFNQEYQLRNLSNVTQKSSSKIY